MSGGVFTGTPPSVISITAGGWSGGSAQYDLQSSTTTEARYNLAPWPGDYDIVFSIDQSTGDLVLDVQDPNDTQQQYDPYKFSIGASSAHTSGVASGPVQAGDTIRLWTSSAEQARIVVHANLAVTGWSSGGGSSNVTVTGITWLSNQQQYSDGVTTIIPDGEFVTNDTITASDCTLYKDFQSYANSNITIVNDKFQITKSGTGMYSISVGGYSDTLSYVDESWLATIGSNSSSRTTNSTRIRDILAKIPDDIKFHRLIGVYSPIDTGVAQARGPYTLYWKQFDDLGWTKSKTDTSISYRFKYLNTNPNNTSAWYTDPYTETHMFEVREMSGEIKCRFTRYKWFNDLSLNNGNPAAHVLHSSWMEVGANSWKQWVWSYDAGETRHGVSNYDPWLVDERFWVKVSDWVYYEEPEGDDEGPDGNPPNNYPPSDNPPDNPTDDPDGPKHQYPGDKYLRRRRAHSFW